MRLLGTLALAFLCSNASATDAGAPIGSGYAAPMAACKMVSGGRMQGLKSLVIWQARVACRDSTMIWFETPVESEGAGAVRRVDDLLIVSGLSGTQTLSLFAPPVVDCRHAADGQSMVIAAGEWNARARQGKRQPVYRAWRLDAQSRRVEELPARDVVCVLP